MSVFHCPRERDVTMASSAGRWMEELNAHTASCRHCRKAALVASAFGVASLRPPSGISPSTIWLRARLARRQRAEAQVSRILAGAQIAIGSLVAGAFVATGHQVNWWTPGADAAIPASLVALVGALMVATVAATSFISRENE